MSRLIVTNADVQRIMGCGRTKAHEIMASVNKDARRLRARYATAEDFCTYTGLSLELVLKQLR